MTDPDASLRVSDAERDQTLRVLGEHAAVGRLTLDELEERSSRALAAKTRGELATLTGDLPQEAGQDRPAPTLAKKPVRWMVAIMSGSQRRGRFRAVGSINAISRDQNEALGVRRGWLHQVFTRRQWRRRGVARATIARSLVNFRDRGMEEAALGVDAENPLGAFGLYESLGFGVTDRFTALRKPLRLGPGD